MKSKVLTLALIALTLPACLQTRAALKQDNKDNTVKFADKIETKQQKDAKETSRFDEINQDFRSLYGRVEGVESQLNQLQDNEKIKNLEFRLAQTEMKMALLETTVAELNAKAKKEIPVAGSSDAKNAKGSDENPLSAANKFFDSKKWEDAILAYEEYRKNNPKGKAYAEATYKIGVSFQNLSMKEDAKVFFKELVDKYPQSREAGLAKSKLKKL